MIPPRAAPIIPEPIPARKWAYGIVGAALIAGLVWVSAEFGRREAQAELPDCASSHVLVPQVTKEAEDYKPSDYVCVARDQVR